MSYFEKNAIISGLGISRIGRRTGIPGAELTLEAARAAIEDAGLTADDIDGIATFGDTPLTEVADALGIQPTDASFGFDTGGVLTPVMSAFRAVAERRARHVLVYRTVLMLGGSMTDAPATSAPNPLASPPIEPHIPGTRRKLKPFEDIDELLAAHAYSAANWLAMHCRRHMDALWDDQGAAGLVGDQQQAQRGTEPACRVPGADDHGRLLGSASCVYAFRAVRL